MADTRIKAGQFYGVIGHGTDGYFLMTNADGSMSWAEGGASGPSVTSVDYPGDDTAADPAGGQTVVLTGTNFGSSMTVSIGGTTAPSVAHDSSTQLTITTPAKAAGDYDIVVTNTVTGASGTFVNGISYNGIPTWTTAAGSLGTFESETTISTITLQATEPDGGTITFNITNGALPSGLSLTGANIDGTTTAESSTTLYSFTIEAIDDENQSTPRNFSITVNSAAIIPSENFTINTYTGNGSSQSIEGKIGTAADFNGSSSVITHASRLGLGTNPTHSVSLWVNFAGTSNQNLYGFGDTTTAYVHSGIQVDSSLSRIYHDNNGSADLLTNYSFSTGQWYHIVLTYDSSTSGMVLYVDGTQIATGTITLNITSSAFRIGRRPGYNNNYVDGKIEQFRVFNKALSSSEVTTLYGEPSNPSSASTTDIFDDGSGVALYNFKEGAKDTGGVNGYIGAGGVFDGSSSYTTINSTSTTPFDASSEDFSISAWINVSSFQNDACVISKWGSTSTDQSYFFGFNGSADNTKLIVYEKSGSTTHVINSTSTTITTGNWFHVAYVRNSTQTIIYINGVAETFSNTNTINSGNSQPIIVGRQDGYPGTSFNGKIDQMRLFNKALSSSEVTTLYQETSASATKSTTDIFDDDSGVALYELEGNANDTGGSFGSLVTGSKIDLDVDGYTSGSVADLSGNSNTAAVTGATYGTDPNGGGYFDLDGASDYLQISSSTDFNSATNFTIEGWFKPDSLTSADHFFSIYSLSTPADRKFLLRLADADGDLEFASYNTGGNGASGVLETSNSNVRVIANQWNHIALSYQYSGTIEAFINGISAGTSSSSGTLNTVGSGDLYIGTLNGYIGSYDFDGKVGDVRFYDSALTSSQIVQNFNASKGSYGFAYNGTATNVSYGYDGTATNVDFVGTSFQPDLVWIKNRANGVTNSWHTLTDSVRGGGKRIFPNVSDAESADNYDVLSFQSNGFTIGTGSYVSWNGGSYVAWAWKAGGAYVTDTSGDLDADISANVEAGFSIVRPAVQTGINQSIPHGLDAAPELIIQKTTAAAQDWIVYAPSIFPPSTRKYLYLNRTDAATDGGTSAGSGYTGYSPNSVTDTFIYTPGVAGVSNYDYWFGKPNIMYCFHSVEGYQKIGTFQGTGTTSGNIVTTGFRPRFLMWKSTSATGNWQIVDSIRSPLVDKRNYLYPNLTQGEDVTSYDIVDFNDDSFQLKQQYTNKSGYTYIYLAIA